VAGVLGTLIIITIIIYFLIYKLRTHKEPAILDGARVSPYGGPTFEDGGEHEGPGVPGEKLGAPNKLADRDGGRLGGPFCAKRKPGGRKSTATEGS
jgi:hypothetical protein